MKQAELGRFKLYCLRHSYASLLLQERETPGDVAYVLGHKNTYTTQTFHEHWIPRDMSHVADKLTAARRATR